MTNIRVYVEVTDCDTGIVTNDEIGVFNGKNPGIANLVVKTLEAELADDPNRVVKSTESVDEVHQLVKEYPNDTVLGTQVRSHYLNK